MAELSQEFEANALALLKERLDRMADDTCRDVYFGKRIQQAVAELSGTGIIITEEIDDMMLVVDYAAWLHANRDKQEGMPDWLRMRRRERWLRQS